MPRVRTQEAIAKAVATRAENKRKKDERAAARLAKRQAATAPQPNPPTAPAERRPSTLFIDIDWANIPMPESQELYARLKVAFERAGTILNSRLMAASQTETYECFMAGKDKCCAKGTKHRMPARGTDYENGYKDPKTGLTVPVLICGEVCWHWYQKWLIDERRERNLIPRSS